MTLHYTALQCSMAVTAGAPCSLVLPAFEDKLASPMARDGDPHS